MNIHNLFPTPLGHIKNFLTNDQIKVLMHHVYDAPIDRNYDNIITTKLDSSKNKIVSDYLIPKISLYVKEFGYQLFGEYHDKWIIKKLWGNIMQPNGFQNNHNHVNSVVCGIIYLTDPEESCHTHFSKNYNNLETFRINNEGNFNTLPTEYNVKLVDFDLAKKGDMVIFPAYLHHGVTKNISNSNRVTIAFNSFPNRMLAGDAYEINLS